MHPNTLRLESLTNSYSVQMTMFHKYIDTLKNVYFDFMLATLAAYSFASKKEICKDMSDFSNLLSMLVDVWPLKN